MNSNGSAHGFPTFLHSQSMPPTHRRLQPVVADQHLSNHIRAAAYDRYDVEQNSKGSCHHSSYNDTPTQRLEASSIQSTEIHPIISSSSHQQAAATPASTSTPHETEDVSMES
jgi:hypothetical protein